MKKLLSLILICFVCSSLYAQPLIARVDSLSASINRSDFKIVNINESIDELSKQVENLSYLVETQKEIISQEQSSIENSMGAVNILLTVFSVLVAIGGIFLGWFINSKEKNIQSLIEQVEIKKQEVEKLEEKTSKTKIEITDLNNNINNNIESLYEKLRREETTTYLKRLVYEPNDVANISSLLLSRDLSQSDFKYLLAAYRKLENKNNNGLIMDNPYLPLLSHKGQYLLLFFQHFCGQALCHDLISNDLAEFFPHLFSRAFKNDVINASTSLVNCFNKEDALVNKEEILYMYLDALNKSKFSQLKNPYSIIVQKYRNADELKNVWERLNKNQISIKCFNELLCNKYKDDTDFIEKIRIQNKKFDTK